MSQDYPPDVVRGNTASESSFKLAVEFYELDHDLNKDQRLKLADAYNSISYTSIGSGWLGFLTAGSIPFVYNRVGLSKTQNGGLFGALKLIKPEGKPNLGVAIIFGVVGMMFASPIGSGIAYSKQLEKLKSQDKKCAKVMELLKPSESMKWWMYYKLTVEKPDFIMKDPRGENAYKRRQEKQGKSAIYENGRDPIGLYSGPRAELRKKRSQSESVESDNFTTENAATGEENQQDDPFESKPPAVNQEYASAWDKIRLQNQASSGNPGNSASSGSAWNRIRQQGGSKVDSPQESSEEINSFDELLEKERHSTDNEENDKW